MNKTLLIALVTLGLSVGAMAQHQPRFELFGGYSLESIPPCGTGCRVPPTNFNGWNVSLTGYFYKAVGITADFSGHYASHIAYDPVVGSHRHSVLLGPTYSFRGALGSVFVHALFGEISQSSSQLSTLDYTKFAWAAGGGLDLNVARRLSMRPVQLDFERSTLPSFSNTSGAAASVNGFRYSGGVVLKF